MRNSSSAMPLPLAGFVAALVAIAIAYGSAFLPGGAPIWAPWLLAIGSAASMVSVMILGAARATRPLGGLRWAFAAVFVVMAGGLCLALALPAETTESTLWLGLPRRAAILIYGIGLLPITFLPFAYAMTFDRITLSDADLARLREQVAALRAAERAAGPS